MYYEAGLRLRYSDYYRSIAEDRGVASQVRLSVPGGDIEHQHLHFSGTDVNFRTRSDALAGGEITYQARRMTTCKSVAAIIGMRSSQAKTIHGAIEERAR